ncbi:MAG: GGDEF domain-containing protein [Spirochaetales bacterium]|nr:GGDEF domain-containing protein [Spirochaetales bacterium]
MDNEIVELIENSKELFFTNIDLSHKMSERAISLARLKHLDIELAEALISYAQILSEQGTTTEVLEKIFEAIEILKKTRDENRLVKAYSTVASLYLRSGDLDGALKFYRKSQDYSNISNLTEELPGILLGIGTVLHYKESFDDAIEYYVKAYDSASSQGAIEIGVKILNNLGCVYNSIGKLNKAEEYLYKCIDICKEFNYFNIMVPAIDELGVLYLKKGREQDAVNMWKEAINIDLKRGDRYTYIAPHINLANYYFDKKDWATVNHYLEVATNLCMEVNSKIDLLEILKLNTRICESREDYKGALDYYKKFVKLESEIQKQDSVRELKELELETLEFSRDRILALSRIGRRITESLDLNIMLTTIYTNISKLMEFSVLGIARFHADTGQISYEMFVENGKKVDSFFTSINDENSIAAWCIRNDRNVYISDFENEFQNYIVSINKIKNYCNSGNHFPSSVMYKPLKIKGEVIGLITVQSQNKNAYSSDDVNTFEVLSSYAAIGLNNALQSEMIIEQNRQLSILATIDSLTGLKNRRDFFNNINNVWGWAVRNKIELTLMIMDLDFFKKINDTYGHPAGDYCLIEVSKTITEVVKRENDIVARLGGEEFGVFLSDCDINSGYIIAEKIRKEIENKEFIYENKRLPVTTSIGISTLSPWLIKESTIDDLMSQADNALYKAKENGRNCSVSYHAT